MQAESTRQVALLNDQERQNVRQQVLQTMFYYRATGQTDAAKWRTLLDERFALTQPVAPYRAFYGAEVVKNQRVVVGVEGMIADTKSLWTLLQSIGQPHRRGENAIFGLALNYGTREYENFIGSARRAGFAGDVVIATQKYLPRRSADWLRRHEVCAVARTSPLSGMTMSSSSPPSRPLKGGCVPARAAVRGGLGLDQGREHG